MFKYLIIAVTILASSCGGQNRNERYPNVAYLTAKKVFVDGSKIPIYIGGYGSSIIFNSTDNYFYLLTDRGPNIDGVLPETKVFPIPDFAPKIGKFKLERDSLILVEDIVLKDYNGKPFSGLPNKSGDGVTGETAYNLKGDVINNVGRGIDPEGLAISADGSFWVSDEYAPFIMQFDRNGNLLKELSPSKGLPEYYSLRRPNRGMEGLTMSKDGEKIFGIMQSPLYFPNESTKNNSVNNRILEINIKTGDIKEYLYQMEHPKNVVSEICFVDKNKMLVLERDAKFPNNGKGFKRIYEVSIEDASNIHNVQIETLTNQNLKEIGIKSVSKHLLVDILKEIPNYTHDKPEGISLIGDSILCISNDDDFRVTSYRNSDMAAKINHNNQLDKNNVYFIRLKNR